MKLRLFFTMAASLALIILFNACSTTDYYRDRAVQRARKFILEEEKSLTLEQQEYIKFNKPVIMAEPIFSKLSTESATSGTLSHVCIAWVIPGQKNAHVVFGVSDNRLKDWTPNRVIIKRYDKPAREYHAAKRKAVIFAMNNFLYLSNKDLNRIRFEVPETIITDYTFTDEKLKGRKLSQEKIKSLVQVTFVWPSSKAGHKLFVCGVGAKNLSGWMPIFGGETTVDELRRHFLSPISFGQNITGAEGDIKIEQLQGKIKESAVTKQAAPKEPEIAEVKEVQTEPEAKKAENKDAEQTEDEKKIKDVEVKK